MVWFSVNICKPERKRALILVKKLKYVISQSNYIFLWLYSHYFILNVIYFILWLKCLKKHVQWIKDCNIQMHFNHIISLFWRTSSPRFSTSWLYDWLNYWCKIWENHSRNKPQRVEGGEVDKKKTKWQGHIVKWNFSKSLSSKNISFTFNRLTLKLLAYNSLTNCPMRMKDNSSEAATLECHCLYQKDKAFRCTERAFGVT